MSILSANKKAHHDYTFHEYFEAGMVLSGSEVKSVRAGSMNLKGAFVIVKNMETRPSLVLINAHIPRYRMSGTHEGYDPTRSRKLLLHKAEIRTLIGKIQQKGLTLVPIKVYTKGSRIKLEFALASGKQKHDKRDTLKKRDTNREIRRIMKQG